MQQRDQVFYHNNTYHYKVLRNKVIREIPAAKKSYHPAKPQHLEQFNISQWYGKLKELIGLEKQTPSFKHHSSEEET